MILNKDCPYGATFNDCINTKGKLTMEGWSKEKYVGDEEGRKQSLKEKINIYSSFCSRNTDNYTFKCKYLKEIKETPEGTCVYCILEKTAKLKMLGEL
jgi:hypothetical protein